MIYRPRVLVLFNQRQDNTITEVAINFAEWMAYYEAHESLEVDFKRVGLWSDQSYNNEIKWAIGADYDYIFQYDCDMTARPQLLGALIKAKKECIGALFFQRDYPHKPQIWQMDLDERGQIDMFYEYTNKQFILDAIRNKDIIQTDARGTGMTLFNVDALNSIGFPYGETVVNKRLITIWNGWDMTLCAKFKIKFGGVWNLCDNQYDVKHWQYIGVNETNYISANSEYDLVIPSVELPVRSRERE